MAVGAIRISEQSTTDTVLPLSVDRSEAFRIKRRFLNINRLRLARIRDRLRTQQQIFFDLMPLLFHTNHPLMPGWVGNGCPSGLSDYTVTKNAVAQAKRVARSFALRKGLSRRIDIHALYLMGSSGTVAQSSNSDFDVWLCHSPSLTDEQSTLLRDKCVAIETWAASLGLEVHFFLMNPELFRRDGAEQLSSESSGTAQRYLLLDEFYRTGVLVQGRAPVWWVVPPELEDDYENFVEVMHRHRFINPTDYIDFGPVAAVQPAEFLGATLWQLTKAIDAPHKSLLKILLLESYASDYPRLDLLSLRYKRAVYDPHLKPTDLDPYIMLFQKVEEHLRVTGDTQRLDLARRCFYLKADVDTASIARRSTWAAEAVAELVESWGWSKTLTETLDCRSSWKVDQALEERKDTVAALKHSYRSLSMFARNHSDTAALSDRDMTILGRKLFIAFEQKSGKIEVFNPALAMNLAESHLYFQQVKTTNSSLWYLHRIAPQTDATRPPPTKRCATIVELVAWCHFNGLLTSTTRVIVEAVDSPISTSDVEELAQRFRKHFPAELTRQVSVDALAAPAMPVAIGCFINYANSDSGRSRAHTGDLLTSNRSDALSYSAWHENLIEQLDYLVLTSWGEVLLFTYLGCDEIIEALSEHLRWISSTSVPQQVSPSFSCVARYRNVIVKRIAGLFSSVTRWFFECQKKPSRYILRERDTYHVLVSDDSKPAHDFHGDIDALFGYLETPLTTFLGTRFDTYALDDGLLGGLFKINRARVIQFFFLPCEETARVFVIDEHGALFTDEIDYFSEVTLLNHFGLFFDSVEYRRNAGSNAPSPIEYHRIVKDAHGMCTLELMDYAYGVQPGLFFNLKVIGEFESERPQFSIYCDEHEFSTREFGTRLFEVVAEHVLQQRQGRARYPIYITDLDLSWLRDTPEVTQLQTMQYLRYKKRIERKLNHVLSRMARTQ